MKIMKRLRDFPKLAPKSRAVFSLKIKTTTNKSLEKHSLKFSGRKKEASLESGSISR